MDRLYNRDAETMARARIENPDFRAAFRDLLPEFPIDLPRCLVVALDSCRLHLFASSNRVVGALLAAPNEIEQHPMKRDCARQNRRRRDKEQSAALYDEGAASSA